MRSPEKMQLWFFCQLVVICRLAGVLRLVGLQGSPVALAGSLKIPVSLPLKDNFGES
jgi:hypothetical protein